MTDMRIVVEAPCRTCGGTGRIADERAGAYPAGREEGSRPVYEGSGFEPLRIPLSELRALLDDAG